MHVLCIMHSWNLHILSEKKFMQKRDEHTARLCVYASECVINIINISITYIISITCSD